MGLRARIAIETGLTAIGIALIAFGANVLMGPWEANALLQGVICIGIGALLIALDKYLVISLGRVSVVLKNLIPWLVAGLVVSLVLVVLMGLVGGWGYFTQLALLGPFIILCVIVFCAITSD